jgi:hypothetical protein
MSLRTIAAAVIAVLAVSGGAGSAHASVERHGAFARAPMGFMGCVTAADGANDATACISAHSEGGGLRVVVKSYGDDGAPLLGTSYFEEALAPSTALTTTAGGGVPKVHLDVTLPRTGRIVLDTTPMSSVFLTQSRAVQVQCGMTAMASSDDGSAAISGPSYVEGMVHGERVVNADRCSFYWVAPASGQWSMAAPTDESPMRG